MIEKVEQFIQNNHLFSRRHKLLVAFSGGRDSVALSHLLLKCGYNIALGHCNFQLRGEESDADQLFCLEFAKTYQIPIHIQVFKTAEYARSHKLSFQVAARRLRYNWFDTLTDIYDYILTAHHASDLIETTLYHLLRSKSFDVLQNIPVQSKKVVRPFLVVSRQDIDAYITKNQLAYREDSTNEKDEYTRNYIRHKIIPLLKEINPSLETHLEERCRLYKMQLNQLTAYWQDLAQIFTVPVWFGFRLLYSDLEKYAAERRINLELFMFNWLECTFNCSFNERKAIIGLLKAKKTAKRFQNTEFLFNWNRGELEIYYRKRLPDITQTIAPLKIGTEYLFNPYSIQLVENPSGPGSEVEQKSSFDLNKIKGKLRLRFWRDGDLFQPLNSPYLKKISDLLKDAHISTIEKKYAWVIEDDKKIIYLSLLNVVSDSVKVDSKQNPIVIQWRYIDGISAM
jgi:tRNA(Ile)-lysidine synthase